MTLELSWMFGVQDEPKRAPFRSLFWRVPGSQVISEWMPENRAGSLFEVLQGVK